MPCKAAMTLNNGGNPKEASNGSVFPLGMLRLLGTLLLRSRVGSKSSFFYPVIYFVGLASLIAFVRHRLTKTAKVNVRCEGH